MTLQSLVSLERKYKGVVEFDFSLEKQLIENGYLNADINLSSMGIDFDNLKFNNIKGNINIHTNIYTGNININSFYSGKISSEIIKDKNEKIIIKAKGSKIKLEPLIRDWAGQSVSGTLDCSLDLSFSEDEREGNFSARIIDGEIEETPYQIKIYHALNDLVEDIRDVFYTNITINADIKNNQITFNNFFVKGKKLDCTISGNYDLKSRYNDLTFDMKFDEGWVQNIPNFVFEIKKYIRKVENNWYYINYLNYKGVGESAKTSFK